MTDYHYYEDDDYTAEDHMEAMDQIFAATVMDDLAWWGYNPNPPHEALITESQDEEQK